MPRVLEPSFLEDLQNDVERLSRAFESLGRETSALVVRTEALGQSRGEHEPEQGHNHESPEDEQPAEEAPGDGLQLSRNARRRMRARLRAALSEPPVAPPPAPTHNQHRGWNFCEHRHAFPALRPPASLSEEEPEPPVPPPSSSTGSSQAQPQPGNGTRNKKKRRHRR